MAVSVDSELATAATAAAPSGVPAASPPIVVDGNVVPAGAAISTRVPEPGYSVSIEAAELFRSGDISITRERTTQNGNPRLNQIVLNTGAGDDEVQVTQRSDGKLDININGQSFEITLAAGQELAVRTADGNDVVHSAPDVKVNMTVEGGAGDDTIVTGAGQDRVEGGLGDDTIVTGDGRDYAFGGKGNDRITAGTGDDAVYGGDGDDRVLGGDGRDFISGGKGSDTIDGGRGDDILAGGQDRDIVRSGEGDDRVYVGAGADNVDNRSGNDVVYGPREGHAVSAAPGASNRREEVPANAALGASIVIDGDAEFKERVEADLEVLRSSPAGQQMLAELDQAAARGQQVTIRELENVRNGSAGPAGPDSFIKPDGTAGAGDDVVIRYNPSHQTDKPPAVVLYHEMSHAYNLANGTAQDGYYNHPGHPDDGIRNAERQAVGLDNDGIAYDFDHNPATPADTANPPALSENGLRSEMGLPDRLTYATSMPSPATPLPGGTTPSPPVPGPAPGGGTAAPSAPTSTDALNSYLDRMLGAMQTGDTIALRNATRELTDTATAQSFRNEAVAQVDKQQAPPALPEAPQPEAEAQRAGPRR